MLKLLPKCFAIKLAAVVPLLVANGAFGFEGRIAAVLSQGNETVRIAYTFGTNMVRIESTVTNQISPVDLLDLRSGTLTLLFPHNRSFVRLKKGGPGFATGKERTIEALALTQESKTNPQPGNLSGARVGSGLAPIVPAILEEGKLELRSTEEKTNILGFACRKYELKRQGETLEIWATEQLLPFQAYVRNQIPRFGPRTIEEEWPALMTSRELFPLLATLRLDNGPRRFRFEVISVTSEKISDADGKLFQVPADYVETRPLPF
jgi:hypothetical protein